MTSTSQYPSQSSDTNGQPPQLPPGTTNSLRGISENFAFHSSPESFVASRIAQWQKSDPSLLDRRTPIRAKILNRNVAVVSSYRHIQYILNHDDSDDTPAVIASKAYHELMNEFFPPPNLLLADGCPHRDMRTRWDGKMKTMHGTALKGDGVVAKIVERFFENRSFVPLDQSVDLYETMKTLSWHILLGTFLGLSPDEKLFAEFQRLHEELLRGQFSLLPVSVNVRMWQSPRSKGIKARKRLQELIAWRVHDMSSRNRDDSEKDSQTFLRTDQTTGSEEVRDHILMSTSSLAVKGLASLLTAFFLNLFLLEINGTHGIERLKVMAETGEDEVRKYFRSVYLETERLSPPIVGIMRRLTRDMVLENDSSQPGTLLPKGWDVWLYFVGGGRDPTEFGEAYMTFDPTRYFSQDVPEPLAFGTGPKGCLGKSFMRDIALLVAEQCLTTGLSIEGDMSRPGLRGWLGWQDASPEQWAADMKQLPTQHPSKPVSVRFVQY